MRDVLLCGLLLLLLGIGVVQANRKSGDSGLVSGFTLSEGAAPEAPVAPASPDPEPVAPTPAEASRPSVLAAGELSVLGAPDPDPMVRYFDAEGSLHMVRGLDRVPPEHRADAVVLGSDNVNVVSIPAPTAVAFQDWKPDPNPNRSGVVLFSAEWCGACKRAKRHMDRRGIAYRERDIDFDDSARDQVRRVLGRVALPLLEVRGRFISGFRPDVYDRALGSG